jgi:hypothetical protein
MEQKKNILIGKWGHVYLKHKKLTNQWVIDWDHAEHELHVSELMNFDTIEIAVQLEKYKFLFVNSNNIDYQKEFLLHLDNQNKLKVSLNKDSFLGKSLELKILYH